MSLRRVAYQPTWLLSRAHARAQGILHEAFAAAGARGYHYRLLAALEQYGPASQADLARRTGIDPKDVVHALNDMAGRGLLARETDPADRRRNIVRITDAGDAELTRLDDVVAGIQDEVLRPLSVEQRAQLREILALLG